MLDLFKAQIRHMLIGVDLTDIPLRYGNSFLVLHSIHSVPHADVQHSLGDWMKPARPSERQLLRCQGG